MFVVTQQEAVNLIRLRDDLAESIEINVRIGNMKVAEERRAEFDRLGEILYGRKQS